MEYRETETCASRDPGGTPRTETICHYVLVEHLETEGKGCHYALVQHPENNTSVSLGHALAENPETIRSC